MESQAKQLFRTSLGSLPTKRAQIARGLDLLMAGFPNARPTGESLALYAAILDVLTPEEIIAAFARASSEEWFPSPGRLIALSGHADAMYAEALRELLQLAEMLCTFPMLKPKMGVVLNEGRDLDTDLYLPLEQQRRGPSIDPPELPETTFEAVKAMGDGDAVSGLRRITPAVPGLLGKLGDDQSFELRQAESVKRAWVAVYRAVAT